MLVTVGSVSRQATAERFWFLAERCPGRRTALREFTHRDPDFVFWVDPRGRLIDARGSHLRNPPPGHEHVVNEPPDYGGFLRGRVASLGENQLIVVYCRPEALATAGTAATTLFARGMDQVPVPLRPDALVVSDNGDLYGTLLDVMERGAVGT
jgi:hypothetical protein